MFTIPESYYLAFEKVRSLEEYFEGRPEIEEKAGLQALLEQVLILTPHNSRSIYVEWQKKQLYDENNPPELSIMISTISSFLLAQGYQNVLNPSYIGGMRDVYEKLKNTSMDKFRNEKAWAFLYHR
ncbi:hypothetical protein BY458DRAFT_137649 [Sporodiniella umbellata]|nr:hypothetical protein BY458DRAFT_137649 [Sporodiniella umbellata]